METFVDFQLSNQLNYALEDLGFSIPTPIQQQAYSVIRSGKDMIGIAQTGTGKTLAYLLPILQDLKFSKQIHPRVLILVPTRELVVQVVDNLNSYGKYLNHRVLGVYGGTNINSQKKQLMQGCDVLVATPGRLYDLMLSKSLKTNEIRKVVIDEVDVMLDLGFRFQLQNILDILPKRRQHILFSATMTEAVSLLIETYFNAPIKVSVAMSGTPLKNIEQKVYAVPNFYTKANLVLELMRDIETFTKILVFVDNKRNADRLLLWMQEQCREELAVIHANKTQNHRLRTIEAFNAGKNRLLITTDIMARGLDLDGISHVICVDVPKYPENYIHRIGRTGRAEAKGTSILLCTPTEIEAKERIEDLMKIKMEEISFPKEVEIATELIPAEQPKQKELNSKLKHQSEKGAAFHEKKEKNKKVNLGGKYRREIAKKYKKPKTKGDKNQRRKKR
ncbi:MAG: DEAD/DEAH box helicase [Flavobacteriaceae bacterium]|nr:DEAD/DEAH box helicase [Flavobacteriaceae bacterium]